jgi:hypothetical protein
MREERARWDHLSIEQQDELWRQALAEVRTGEALKKQLLRHGSMSESLLEPGAPAFAGEAPATEGETALALDDLETASVGTLETASDYQEPAITPGEKARDSQALWRRMSPQQQQSVFAYAAWYVKNRDYYEYALDCLQRGVGCQPMDTWRTPRHPAPAQPKKRTLWQKLCDCCRCSCCS